MLKIFIQHHNTKKSAIFCICHTRPLFKIPANWNIIWLGLEEIPSDLRSYNIIRLVDADPNLHKIHSQVGGSAGAFLLTKLSSILKNVDSIGIFQYRKIITRNPIGIAAPNYPSMQISSSGVINSCLEIECALDNQDLLISKPSPIKSIIDQYASAHHIEDLLRYTAIAVELGVISPREVNIFLTRPHIFPGGVEFGFLPQDFCLYALRAIQKVAMTYITQTSRTRYGYQGRAVAFCGERLGSYLLEKYLSHRFHNELPKSIVGYMTTISDSDCYIPGQ